MVLRTVMVVFVIFEARFAELRATAATIGFTYELLNWYDVLKMDDDNQSRWEARFCTWFVNTVIL